MRIQVAVPEAQVSARVLDAALEPVTRLNEALLAEGRVPTFDRALRTYGIKWQPEPPGAERFDHAGTVINRRWGDCDDLAPYHAASLRHTKEDPLARAVVKRSGPKTWHAVVMRGDGTIDDPSKRAGMPTRGDRVSGAASCPRMFVPPPVVGGDDVGAFVYRPQIAVRPIFDQGFQARVDIPWFHAAKGKPTPTEYAMATLHAAPVASAALTGAVIGACELAVCGGYGHPEHIQRLSAIADCVRGVPYEELEGVYGAVHARAAQNYVAGFFDDLGSIVKNVVAPIASKVVQFVPGVGPAIATGIDAASHLIPNPGQKFGISNVIDAGLAATSHIQTPSVIANALNMAKGLTGGGGVPMPGPPPSLPSLATSRAAATRAPAPPAPRRIVLSPPGKLPGASGTHPAAATLPAGVRAIPAHASFQPAKGATRLCIPVEVGTAARVTIPVDFG